MNYLCNMKNIHILPTDKSSRLTIMEGKPLLSNFVSWESKSIDWEYGDGINQNIYITSDEEIKDGDWHLYENEAKKTTKETLAYIESSGDEEFKKIILTTDQDLIKDGVQAIDDDFLEWFVKNPSCEKVETHIVKLCTNCGQQHCDNRDCRGYEDEPQYLISYPENTTQRIITYCDGYEVNTEKIIIPKEETLEEVTKQIQNECHNFTKLVVPNVSYQDATNTFLFMKLAELTLKIQNYEK
jgi:hypothetical protein